MKLVSDFSTYNRKRNGFNVVEFLVMDQREKWK